MSAKALPSQDRLCSLLSYDPGTGLLSWQARRACDFATTTDPRGPEWLANSYNSKFAGKSALTANNGGYRCGKIEGVHYQAHRVIWKMVHGVDPDTIDHRNGEKSDNRLANLRDCSVAENSRNCSKPSVGSSSQYRGVCWVGRDRRWAARISNGEGGKRSLGNFVSEEDAARAYDRAARELHGDYATLNFRDPPALHTKEAT